MVTEVIEERTAADAIAESLGGAVMPMDDLAYDVIANLNDVAAKVVASEAAP